MSHYTSSPRACSVSTPSVTPWQRPLVQAIGLAISLSVGAASAATIQVNTANDAQTGMCRLRDAIQAANTDAVVEGCTAGSGTDTIDLSTIANETIVPAAHLPVINSSLSIEGALVTINGNNTFTGPGVNGGATASISNLIISQSAVGATNQAVRVSGGAHLTLNNCTLLSNTTTGLGGAVKVDSATLVMNTTNILNGSASVGAALSLIDATLEMNASVISGNTATSTVELRGSSTATISNSLFALNEGAIRVYSPGSAAVLRNSTFTVNSGTHGSAIRVLNGTLTMFNSTINDNDGNALSVVDGSAHLVNSILANSAVADCFSVSGTITTAGVNLVENQDNCGLTQGASLLETDPALGGPAANGGPMLTLLPLDGSPVINAGDNAQIPIDLEFDQRGTGFPRVFGGTVDLGAVEVQENPQPGPDFVVTSLDDVNDGSCDIAPDHCSLREALIAANSNPDASTITFENSLLMPPGTITLSGSRLPLVTTPVVIQGSGITVDGNQGSGVMGATNAPLEVHQMHLTGGEVAGVGGAILLNSDAALELHDSTLSDNSAITGGGIYVSSGATVRLVNSTLIGNSANNGAAIGTFEGEIELVQSTLVGNTAVYGGALKVSFSIIKLSNSILAGSTGNGDCYSDSPHTITATGVNLVQNKGNCGLVSGPDLIEGTDPMLNALADNGGPTPTMLPMMGSPVLNVGVNGAIPAGLDFDQRGTGFPRVFGGTVDLGSVELQVTPEEVIFEDSFEESPESN